MAKTPLTVRIEKETKTRATEVLDELGLNMTTAIEVYLRQIAQEKEIPFKLRVKTGEDARSRK